MVCKGTYFPPITINYHYYIYSTNETNNTILYLIKVINGDVHVRCHYYNDIVTSDLRNVSQKYFSSLTPLYLLTEECGNIIDETTQREGI